MASASTTPVQCWLPVHYSYLFFHIDGWMDGWMDDGWMDGRTDGRTDGRMDGWMDGWIKTEGSLFLRPNNFTCFWSLSS